MPTDEGRLTRGNNSLNPNYPANAVNNTPTERKKLEPIVSGKVIRKKQSWLNKVKTAICNDEEQSMGDYIIFDIIVPAVKSLIYDTIMGGLEIKLFGERRSRPSNIRRDGNRSYVSYTNYYQGNDQRPQNQIRPSNDRYTFEDCIFNSRGDAENALSRLCDEIENYGMVDVAAFYELCNLPTEYTDHKYGWTNLRDAFTERVRDGYIIKLPRPKILN